MELRSYPSAPDPISHWSRLAGGRTALIDHARGERLTYGELDARIGDCAGMLAAQGVGAGDLVATLAGTRTEHIVLFHAALRVGAALVPLNWRLPAPELAPIVRSAQPALLFVEPRFRALAETAVAGAGLTLRAHDIDHDLPRLLRGAAPLDAVHPASPDTAALVLYTSGSTGTPKGAVLPHRQILYNALATTTSWELGSGDVGLVTTPLFHTGGWNVFATPLWQRGGTVVLLNGFDADDFLDAMAAHACTVALTVPTQLLMLTGAATWGRPLPSLRSFFSGGAPLSARLATAVRGAGYALREGYGLTECGPNCFAMPPALAPDRPGEVGWPIAFLEMRLVNADGREPESGEPGELWLRGPQRFAGYLRDAARTAEAITADGWLRTGDIARRGADGSYAICGRTREMFISGGENVFPGEVEGVLAECAGVAECTVIGMPDEKWGEVGCAFVVRRSDGAPDTDAVLRFARTRLAGYKIPRAIIFMDELPRLGSGKIDRAALRRLVEVRHG